MTTQPWMKFYPADWRADPALRMCSIAARGLWMEMLCIMHESEPRGWLLVKSCALDARDLASICGASVKETNRLLTELERAEVFSRDERGVIYSRRMVRDTEKAAKDKANGGLGGNPHVKAPDNQGVNPQPNPGDKAQKLETRDQKEEKTSLRSVQKKGCRLPAGWQPTPEDTAYAKAHGLPERSIPVEIEKFRNHFHSQPGQKGIKVDWSKTWQNWVLNACEYRGIQPTNGGTPAKEYRNQFGDRIDWGKRAEKFKQTGEWAEMWGDPRDIPPEYRDRFGEVSHGHH